MNNRSSRSLVLGGGLLVSCTLWAQEKIPLTDDVSRADLVRFGSGLSGGKRAYPRRFSFPKDVRASSTFGVDVSHYQGNIDWSKFGNQRVGFVYIKASQGEKGYDPMFKRNWNAVPTVPSAKIRRGAYHFLTAVDPANAQAKNYLSTIGTLGADDLAPCVDIEWDLVKDRTGHLIDRWASLSPDMILEKVQTWIKAVEAATGKQPIIYTNAAWWNSRVGKNEGLGNYRLWVADYASKSLGREEPVVPKNFKWYLWQITDSGVIDGSGLKGGVDTSVMRAD